MTINEFESLLDKCCGMLTGMARKEKFTSSKQFEDAVRRVLTDLLAGDSTISVDFNSPAQAFPDIALGEYGVEVKFTSADTWRSVANSVQETQRVEGVRHIYIVFGKMGGVPGHSAGQNMRRALSTSALPMCRGLRWMLPSAKKGGASRCLSRWASVTTIFGAWICPRR